MTTSGHEKTFIDRIYDDGLAVGRAVGKITGKAEAKAECVLKLLDVRGLAPSQEQRQRVTARTRLAQLDLWFDRALTAGTAAEVFAD